jgi:hypothetical protein
MENVTSAEDHISVYDTEEDAKNINTTINPDHCHVSIGFRYRYRVPLSLFLIKEKTAQKCNLMPVFFAQHCKAVPTRCLILIEQKQKGFADQDPMVCDPELVNRDLAFKNMSNTSTGIQN